MRSVMAIELAPARSSVIEKSTAESVRVLPVLIVYDDAAAYKRALRTLIRVTDSRRDDVRPLPWRFDTLHTIHGRMYAALELAKSEMCVISTSARDRLPVAIEDWLLSTFGGLRGTPGLGVALLGAPGQCDKPESSRFQFLRHVADRAGWDFLAPESAS